MARVYNFSPGPAALPLSVLEQAQAEFLDWHGYGMSLMEMGHRTAQFEAVAAEAEVDLRDLLNIPGHYRVLFLAGGATVQFAMIPLNLLGNRTSADYVDTGNWSKGAIKEAERYGRVNVGATGVTHAPPMAEWTLDPEAAYVHYTSNETITGVQFPFIPDTGDVPLVADMSSDFLSGPLEVSRFGLIYASAQKNIGPAGLTIVIVHEALLGRASPLTPAVFHYKTQAAMHSMRNTPPTYGWYLAGLVFKWLKQQGGLAAMQAINRRKAQKLYRVIDSSDFYENHIRPDSRSCMNVPFFLNRVDLTSRFIQEAHVAGLANLKGHASVGGIRASIYNAMPEAGVDALIEFMQAFEAKHM